MTLVFRSLILVPLALIFGMLGGALVWWSAKMLEWSEELREEERAKGKMVQKRSARGSFGLPLFVVEMPPCDPPLPADARAKQQGR